MPLSCPKCVDRKLEEAAGPMGVKVDVCVPCGGTWLDAGEVKAYFAGAPAVEGLIADGLKLNMATARACPRCGVRLKQFRVPGKSLFIDACETCRGLWMDEGELKLLAEALAALKQAASQAS